MWEILDVVTDIDNLFAGWPCDLGDARCDVEVQRWERQEILSETWAAANRGRSLASVSSAQI